MRNLAHGIRSFPAIMSKRCRGQSLASNRLVHLIAAGFDHIDKLKDIDLDVVRLCFQVFIEEQPRTGMFDRLLEPVVSDKVYDEKTMSQLLITSLSHTIAPMGGGLDMILLCDKVSQGNTLMSWLY